MIEFSESEYVQSRTEINNSKKPQRFSPNNLTIENVSFNYPGEEKLVLKNVIMQLKKGNIYSFVV